MALVTSDDSGGRFPTEGWKGAPEEWPNAGFFIHASEEPGNTSPKSFVEVQGHYGEAGSLSGGRIKGSKAGRSSRTAFHSASGTALRSSPRTAP